MQLRPVNEDHYKQLLHVATGVPTAEMLVLLSRNIGESGTVGQERFFVKAAAAEKLDRELREIKAKSGHPYARHVEMVQRLTGDTSGDVVGAVEVTYSNHALVARGNNGVVVRGDYNPETGVYAVSQMTPDTRWADKTDHARKLGQLSLVDGSYTAVAEAQQPAGTHTGIQATRKAAAGSVGTLGK